MKKFTILATVAVAAIALTSCGTAMKTTSAQTQPSIDGVRLENDPCISFAEEKPVQRAYGVGTHFKESTARNIAEAQARATLARAIYAQITSATTEYANNRDLFSTNTEESTIISDQGGSLNDKVSSISKEVVSNAYVVKTSRYMMPDKQYRIYVCVEYNDDAKAAAEKITKQYKDRLSADQKAQIAFDEDLFEQKIEAQLAKSMK